MEIQPGMRLGQYEITAPLGRGGMGAVYRARDSKLGRDVAVKVLPEEFAADAERLSRFDREAHLLASLNHPHIAGLFDLVQLDGAKFLVMELVEGRTLEDRLREGRLTVAESLTIAAQIADALHAAHEKGIVHRDLKPANVMLREDGRVKVLDFGLARGAESNGAETDVANSPTVARATSSGIILGTAGYMSPEQARGKRVDRRSDIWALGVVLWEMLSGRRLFQGETVSDSLAAVLTRDVDFTALPPDMPPHVLWVLRRCLDRDPKRRFQDAGDVRIALEVDPPALVTDVAPQQRSSRRFLAVLTTILALTTAGLAVALLRSAPRVRPLHAAIVLPAGTKLALTGVQPGPPVVSPDGSRVALVLDERGQRRRLWIRNLGTGEGRFLEGAEGASYPFWSPDSEHVAFFANEKLKRIPVTGGTVLVVAHAPNAKGGSWNQDGVIIFAPTFSSPIFRVPADGGAAVAVTRDAEAGGAGHRFPQFLPDGKRFVYLARRRGEGGHRAEIASLDGGEQKELFQTDHQVHIVGGYALYLRDRTLMAQAFDDNSATLRGSPVPLATSLKTIGGASRIVSDASEDVLIYQTGDLQNRVQLSWVDRSGRVVADLGEPADLDAPALSPDGRTLAVRSRNDLWLLDTASGNQERMTFDANIAAAPVWSPDGKRLAYSSLRTGQFEMLLATLPADGSPQLLAQAPRERFVRPASFSPDGRHLLYEEEDSAGNTTAIRLLDLTGKAPPITVADTAVRFPQPRFSPDGRWIAFATLNPDGVPTVFVVAFPNFQRRWQIGSGERPTWRGDGKELFFHDLDGYLQVVPVTAGRETFAWGGSSRLFQNYLPPMTVDGERFLIARDVGDGTSEPLHMIVHWRRMIAAGR